MAAKGGFFGPSDRALEFGAQYAAVLGSWAELFTAASKLVEANVALGRMTSDASKEFQSWLQETANSPWNWLNPEVMQRFMRSAAMGAPKAGEGE